jgi:cell division septation protein DedD
MEFTYTRALLPGMFLDYDCVIIPELGGFVCNERTAWYDEDKEEMVPPSRDVLFNPNLVYNDGLLAQEIMRAKGLDYTEAMKLVASEASNMIEALKSGRPIEIPRLGRLYTSDDGLVRFLPDAELVRMLGSFGHARIPLATRELTSVLPVIVAPVIEAPVTPPSDKKVVPEPKVIPLRVRLARVAAVVAIPLALGGAWMLTEPESSNTLMSVFPSLHTDVIVSSFTPSDNSIPVISDNASEEIDDALVINYAPDPIPVAPPVLAPPVVPQQINFLIVGGAFSIEENAKSLAKTLRKEGYSPTQHYQSHNKLYLVALGEYESERTARADLAKARKSGRKATWLKGL